MQLDSLRAANASAAAARDLHIQARLAIKQAASGGVTPGEMAQAEIDVEIGAGTGRHRGARPEDGADHGSGHPPGGRADIRHHAGPAGRAARQPARAGRGRAQRRPTLNKAVDAQAEAQRDVRSRPRPARRPASSAALEAGIRGGHRRRSVAQLDVDATLGAVDATRAAGRDAVQLALGDRRRAITTSRTAAAKVVRAERALATARTQAGAGRAPPWSAAHARRLDPSRPARGVGGPRGP